MFYEIFLKIFKVILFSKRLVRKKFCSSFIFPIYVPDYSPDYLTLFRRIQASYSQSSYLTFLEVAQEVRHHRHRMNSFSRDSAARSF